MSDYRKHRSIFFLTTFVLVVGSAAFFSGMLSRRKRTSFEPSRVLMHFQNTQKIHDDLKKAAASMPKDYVDLGKEFFFDESFSSTKNISCAHCHVPEKFFTDGKKTSEGIGQTSRNAPTIFYASLQNWLFWDGRAVNLIDQAQQPIENPLEHGISRVHVFELICKNYLKRYEKNFEPLRHCSSQPVDGSTISAQSTSSIQTNHFSPRLSAYILSTLPGLMDLHEILTEARREHATPAQIIASRAQRLSPSENSMHSTNKDSREEEVEKVFFNFALAIAIYEASIIPPETPFDRFRKRVVNRSANEVPNEKNAESVFAHALDQEFGPSMLSGLRLFFGSAECHLCHRGLTLSDGEFHNTGLASYDVTLREMGRAAVLSSLGSHQKFCDYGKKEPLLDTEGCKQLEFLDREQHKMVGAFKTPTLRFISQTAPYFHDGRADHLEAVISHYENLSKSGILGEITETLHPLKLSSEERSALLDFLKTL